MIEYFNANPHAFWFTTGFALLVIEALVLGFSSGVVLFAGLGALLTGALQWFGLVPGTWAAGIAGFGLCSGGIAALLWKPMKRMQKPVTVTRDRSSDLIGYGFRLQEDITHMQPGVTRYSGIEWRVEIENDAGVEQIAAGALVEVASVDAGVFRVRPA